MKRFNLEKSYCFDNEDNSVSGRSFYRAATAERNGIVRQANRNSILRGCEIIIPQNGLTYCCEIRAIGIKPRVCSVGGQCSRFGAPETLRVSAEPGDRSESNQPSK